MCIQSISKALPVFSTLACVLPEGTSNMGHDTQKMLKNFQTVSLPCSFLRINCNCGDCNKVPPPKKKTEARETGTRSCILVQCLPARSTATLLENTAVTFTNEETEVRGGRWLLQWQNPGKFYSLLHHILWDSLGCNYISVIIAEFFNFLSPSYLDTSIGLFSPSDMHLGKNLIQPGVRLGCSPEPGGQDGEPRNDTGKSHNFC